MDEQRDLRNEIIDAALALDSEIGWPQIHLHLIADRLGVPLTEIRRYFVDLDAIANAWIERAVRAMLLARNEPGFADLPERERLEVSLTCWLDALADHRDAVRDILRYKLRPAHIHHQASLVVALSRTVQWWREAAALTATGRGREREEVVLTGIFGTTILAWLFDKSPGQVRAKRFLHRRLQSRATRRLWPA